MKINKTFEECKAEMYDDLFGSMTKVVSEFDSLTGQERHVLNYSDYRDVLEVERWDGYRSITVRTIKIKDKRLEKVINTLTVYYEDGKNYGRIIL